MSVNDEEFYKYIKEQENLLKEINKKNSDMTTSRFPEENNDKPKKDSKEKKENNDTATKKNSKEKNDNITTQFSEESPNLLSDESSHFELEKIIENLSNNKTNNLSIDDFTGRFNNNIITWPEQYPYKWKEFCKALANNKSVSSVKICSKFFHREITPDSYNDDIVHKKSYNFSNQSWIELCNAIAFKKNLQELIFDESLQEANNKRIKIFFNSLIKNEFISKLSLNNNNIGYEHEFSYLKPKVKTIVKCLANYIKFSKNLKSLRLDHNCFPLPKKSQHLFCDAMVQNKNIENLSFQFNQELFSKIKYRAPLTRFTRRKRYLGDKNDKNNDKKVLVERFRCFLKSLESLPNLKSLNLSQVYGFCSMDHRVMKLFHDFLCNTKSLTYLIIHSVELGNLKSENSILFWNGIANNNTIKILDISNNHLKFKHGYNEEVQAQENFIAMCNAISKNNSIESLKLSHNSFKQFNSKNDGKKLNFHWQTLCDALLKNKSINSLELFAIDLKYLSNEDWNAFLKVLVKKPLKSLDLNYNFLEGLCTKDWHALYSHFYHANTLESLRLGIYDINYFITGRMGICDNEDDEVYYDFEYNEIELEKRKQIKLKDQNARLSILFYLWNLPHLNSIDIPLKNNSIFNNHDIDNQFQKELLKNGNILSITFSSIDENSKECKEKLEYITRQNNLLILFEAARNIMSLHESNRRKQLSSNLCDKILSFLYVGIGNEKNHIKLRETVIKHVNQHNIKKLIRN